MSTKTALRCALAAALTVMAAVAGACQAQLRGTREARAEPGRQPDQPAVPEQHQLQHGPLNGTQNILNIQPVIPIEVSRDWNLITRTILPLVWQPASCRAKEPISVWATRSSPHSYRRADRAQAV